jgi:hypothetical protein
VPWRDRRLDRRRRSSGTLCAQFGSRGHSEATARHPESDHVSAARGACLPRVDCHLCAVEPLFALVERRSRRDIRQGPDDLHQRGGCRAVARPRACRPSVHGPRRGPQTEDEAELRTRWGVECRVLLVEEEVRLARPELQGSMPGFICPLPHRGASGRGCPSARARPRLRTRCRSRRRDPSRFERPTLARHRPWPPPARRCLPRSRPPCP